MNRVKAFLFLSVPLIVACSAASKESRLPVPGGPEQASPLHRPLVQPGDQADGLPSEAFDLLTESTADSCSICAQELRRRAFRILEERFPPGVLLRSDSRIRFMLAPGSTNELILTSHVGGDPALTFRFHTAKDRLVGIAESDMTDGSLAGRCRTAPDGTEFQGAIRIVPFAYGDGPAFSYSPSSNRVQVHCRILEIAGY